MIKIYKESLKDRSFVFFIIVILFMYYFIMQSIKVEGSTHFVITKWLITSNYLSITVNLFYVYWAYRRTTIYKGIRDYSMIRLCEDKITNHMIKMACLNCLLFFGMIYIIPAVIFYKHMQDISLYLIFLCIRMVLFLCLEMLYIMIYFNRNRKIDIVYVFPIIVYFPFHFLVVLPLMQ